jgi:23S rRNA (adenine-N6)-dimethyltransferase
MPAAPRARLSSGVHFLAVPRIAAQLVQSCALDSADLVVEFGPGQGAITTHLAETGARILAVERDPAFVRKLHNRFGENGNVRIVHADAREVPLPRRPFTVVGSIPYALSTALLRRLLSPQRTGLRQAALIVELGFAKRVAAARPRGSGAGLVGGTFRNTARLANRSGLFFAVTTSRFRPPRAQQTEARP